MSCRVPFLVRRLLLASVSLSIALEPVVWAQPGSTGGGDQWGNARPAAVLQPEDEALLDELQRAALRFFTEQSDPHTGLVRDRARADGSPSAGKASIAACGFALSAWAVGARRGWMDRATALEHVLRQLRFLATQAPRQRGFFYHFMEMDTGARAWQCELSPIDTGIFLASAIMAREYFNEPEVTELVDGLYRDVDWNWFLNQGPTLAMGWRGEVGFSRFRWDRYSEHMMLSLVGMGAPNRPLPADYWRAWSRLPVGTYAGYHYIQGAPLFIHQYTHAYVDFRGLRDEFADYFRNSVLATLAQRQFCMDLRDEFPTWNEWLWGITASDSSTGYKAWGGPPRTTDFNALDGTIVPCAAAGSVPFTPYETMQTLRHMRTVFGDRIWRRYGFVDAFNPETGWVNPDVIGIDLGITLLQAENARSGFVWSVFMHAPEVQRALARAGFLPMERSLPWADRDRMREIAAEAWTSFDAAPLAPEMLGLRLSATLAARAIGLLHGDEAAKRVKALLAAGGAPTGERAMMQYVASLVTLRQAIPSLANEVTRRLESVDWASLVPGSDLLGSASRLAVFFQIAAGFRPAADWAKLVRTPEAHGPVYVLAPGRVSDQLLPGLWLDERSIITGASAAQLAYALIREKNDGAGSGFPYDVLTTALLIEHFPLKVAGIVAATPPPAGWLEAAAPADRAALLISLANLLAPDCMRDWFQQDPLTRAGRAAIPDFAAEAFGRNCSVYWRYELAGPLKMPPERRAVAVHSSVSRESWRWTVIKGLEYKDSVADVRPGDPDLEMRFAFTWDAQALHFHAEVMDTPPGFSQPAKNRGVELFIDPQGDGLVWAGPDDFQFSYKSTGAMEEWFHSRPATGRVQATATGYIVDADIPWTTLGVQPQVGLEIGVSPAVITEGFQEWDPSLKLNWRFFQRPDDRFGLGTVRLE